ncbi:hypothetical protein M434DRAFT_14551 [Hypoxylon sp. CO27-5]|nr:hypothetical protein M434DRAFT_14551 [Hypoxylon sp. CO27-5]
MAKKTQKAAKPAASSASASASRGDAPPTQLMDLVESFLSDQGFDNAHREFQKHRAKKGWKEDAKKQKEKTHHSLVSVFQTWKTFSSQSNTPVLPKEDPIQKITKVSSSSSDDSSSESESDSDDSQDVAMDDAPAADESSSSESSSSDDSSSESDSESESDEEEAKPAKPATGVVKNGVNPLKRKAKSDSESSSESDSDEDMSDSSSEEGKRPQTKRAKTTESSDESSSSSSSDSSDDESSEDEDEAEPKATSKSSADNDESSSSSESDSDESDSESDEEPKVDLKEAAQVPLPESGSSSSESESESDSETKKAQRVTKDSTMNNSTGSDSSVTLDTISPDAPLPPDPTALKSNNRGKNGAKNPRGQNQPFSRIRKDVSIDPRLSSNAYVSHGYGEKAHQDLIVTKGKGFTKEKNKKKRGSYKGGPLDIHKSRSIKFDD